MKLSRVFLSALLWLLASVVVSSGMISRVSGQDTTICVVNPTTENSSFLFSPSNAGIGTRFNATIWVYEVAELFTYQVFLVVDDELLNVTNAWIPTWDPGWVYAACEKTIEPDPALYDRDMDLSMESVKMGSAILTGDLFYGSGILAIIEFEIIHTPASGSIACDLFIDDPIDTFLLDYDIQDMTASRVNGHYEYGATGLGDLNGDFKVDVYDVATCCIAFGSFSFHPRWNPTADLNQDGRIDVKDLVLIAANFGEIYA